MALTRNKHYLDNEGLRQVWAKVTALVESAVATLTTMINGKASPSDITNAINALDVSDTAVQGKVVTAVSETNGKITVTKKGYDAYDKATADVRDATEIITTDNNGPTSTAPLLYRRPATALWNYIKGKADVEYMPAPNSFGTVRYPFVQYIGDNLAGTIYGVVCKFKVKYANESRAITMQINARSIVHNLVIYAGSNSLVIYDNTYGISSSDSPIYGAVSDIAGDSTYKQVTIYMRMVNYRTGASVVRVELPVYYYATAAYAKDFEYPNYMYVTTLPAGYVTATVNACAKYDASGNDIETTYMKKSSLLEITNSNYSTYYNSSTQTLNLPANVNTIIFSNSTLLEIKNITGITENGRRLSLLVSTNFGIEFKESNSGDYRLGRYIHNYIHNSAGDSIGRNIYEGFIDLILWNKVWYSKTY